MVDSITEDQQERGISVKSCFSAKKRWQRKAFVSPCHCISLLQWTRTNLYFFSRTSKRFFMFVSASQCSYSALKLFLSHCRPVNHQDPLHFLPTTTKLQTDRQTNRQTNRPVVRGRTGRTQDPPQRSVAQHISSDGHSESLLQYEVHGLLDRPSLSVGQTRCVWASAGNLSVTCRRNAQLSRQLSSTYNTVLLLKYLIVNYFN